CWPGAEGRGGCPHFPDRLARPAHSLMEAKRRLAGVDRTGGLSPVIPQEAAMPDTGPHPTPSQLTALPPELANHAKFRILGELGRGGMGVIYLAEHRVLEKPVALKVINSALLDHPNALARFQAEARAAGRLDHPNIARAHDADSAGNLHFLVL